MKPQMMSVPHLPPEQFGDCYRACIASILEVSIDTVPHCGARGEAHWHEEHAKLDAWLADRDMFIVFHKFDAKHTAENIELWKGVGYHLIGGRSPRGPHFTVGLAGVVIHDPSPLGGGLVPDEDGTWSFGYLVRGAPR